MMTPPGCSAVLSRFKRDQILILVDDSSPQKRAVLVSPAQNISTQTTNKILHLSGGLLCVAINTERASSFALQPMTRPRTSTVANSQHAAATIWFTSVEAREGVTTGISAADRSATIRILGEDQPIARKLVKPGHIFPVLARDGGVLVRHSLIEGAFDVVQLSQQGPAAVVVDLLDRAGEHLSATDQQTLATQHNLPLLTLSDLVKFRLEREQLVTRVAEAKLPTRLAGEMRSFVYRSSIHTGEHIALVKGDLNSPLPVLTRVHTECTVADVFGGDTPPSRYQLDGALKAIGERGRGVLLYLRRPYAGQLREQIQSWRELPREKPDMLMREYGLGAQILRDLGVRQIELLTNSTKNLAGLTTFGIQIVSQHPIPIEDTREADKAHHD